MRKLVTVQKIVSLDPIDGADRIEVARVLGWNVVVQKGLHEVGDLVAFFEIDSLLPETNPAFESFQKRGQKKVLVDGVEVKGHVLKTAKLRGQISQGLIIPLRELDITGPFNVGDELTDSLGVLKWEPPIPVGNGNIVGKFDTRFAPKTDAIRIQTIAELWDVIKSVDWEPTVKVDGSSTTLVNDDGKIRIFSRNWEVSNTGSNFQIAERDGLVEAIKRHPGMAIQFEFVGPGIQGNRLRLPAQKAIVFAVWQNRVKLPRSEWDPDILRLATPVLSDDWKPNGTVDEMIEKVDGLRGQITKDALDEGIVFHPVDPNSVPAELANVLDSNLNWKIVSRKWLLKGGD